MSLFQQGLRRKGPERDLEAELQREREIRQKKDDFLAAASHYIDTPLSAVVGFAELLRDRTRDFSAGVRNQLIELLAIQAEETAQVVNDLLVSARFDLGDLDFEDDIVNLRDVVERATRDWASQQRARLTITGNALARADGKWVVQIVRNLLRNADSFGGENTWVRITDGFNKTVLEVVDDGDGVADAVSEKIFEPYYSRRQLDGLAPSLGLGLHVARRLARAMGGDVRYRRDDDESVFEVTLPKVTHVEAPDLPDVVIDPTAGRPTKTAITDVLVNGGPEMVYQPVMDMRAQAVGDPRVVGYESLARFPYSTPPEWFEVAGHEGLRLDLELAAIRTAIAGFTPADRDGFLALNLSDGTLISSRLADSLVGIDPGLVVLELSEVALIKSYEVTNRAVDILRDRGIRLAVDDVGSGEIDLWHILRLQPAVIKIDICLVRDIEDSPRNGALIRGIAAMAQDLGIMVVAEGIESDKERDRLLELGVQYGQGYLFGRPRPLRWKSKVLSGEDV